MHNAVGTSRGVVFLANEDISASSPYGVTIKPIFYQVRTFIGLV